MVRPHRTTATVAITLALTASLASTASADPVPLARAEAAIAAAHSSAPVGPNLDQQAVGLPSRTTVHVTASDRGFDWGDAGIGAGATIVLLGVGLAGTRVATSTSQATQPAGEGNRR
jgi:hypothetical protein